MPQWPSLRKRGLGLSISFKAWHNRMMTDAGDRQAKREAERNKRLSAELRANLLRRKAQTRARRAGDEDDRAGLPAAQTIAPVKPEGGK